jgi:hypothetical protein
VIQGILGNKVLIDENIAVVFRDSRKEHVMPYLRELSTLVRCASGDAEIGNTKSSL